MHTRHPADRHRRDQRDLWIRTAVKNPGALHRQLGVDSDERIPVTFMRSIRGAKIGETVKNPTEIGVRKIRVTPTLKRRVVLALTLRELG